MVRKLTTTSPVDGGCAAQRAAAKRLAATRLEPGGKDTGRGCSLSVIGYEHLTRPKSFHLRTAP